MNMKKKYLIATSVLSCAVAFASFGIVGNAVTDVSAKTVKVSAKSGKDKKDDTKEIQAALDKAKNGTVVIPKGTYYSQVLYLKGNTTLKLQKGAVMKKLAFKKHPESAWVVFHSKKKGYKGFKHVTITGGTWDGQVHKNNKTSEHKGFEIDHGQNVKITHTTIKNMSGMHMIEVNACKNVTIDHVTFKNQYFYSGKNHSHVTSILPSTCEAFQFDSAMKEAAYAQPYDGTVCQNVTVTNNKFENVQSGLGSHHDEKSFWSHMHKNVVVSNNTFGKLKADAIHLNNIDGVTVTNNKAMSGGTNFMTFYHSYNAKTSGNKCAKFKTPYQVAHQSQNVTSDGDSFTATKNSSSPAYAVFVDGGSSLTMNNATIAAKKKGGVVVNNSSLTLTNSRITSAYSGSYGVTINSGKAVNVTGNTISCKDGRGMIETGGESLTADANTITGTKHGIQVKNAGNVTLSNNNINVTNDAMRFEGATATLTGNHATGAKNFIAVDKKSTVTATGNSSSGCKTALQVNDGSTATVDGDSYLNTKDSTSPDYTVFVAVSSSLTMRNTTIDAKKQGAINVESSSSLDLSSSNITATNNKGNYGITAHSANVITATGNTFTSKGGTRTFSISGCNNLTLLNNTATGYNGKDYLVANTMNVQ